MTMSSQSQEQQPSNKEMNFRNLEAKYQRELEIANAKRIEAERVAQEYMQRDNQEEETTDPYVDHKKLDKKLARHGENIKQQTQSDIQNAVQTALREERKANWIKSNPDFYDTLKHAEKLAERDPDLADSILEMPESFERQKLVYKNIKALGLHKPEVKQSTVQETIDANRRSPYYQPSNIGSAPFAGSQSNFSAEGQKSAYEKMQQLKKSLRI
jgi:hypothetical protein